MKATVFHRHQRGQERDDRLSHANVALEQAVHRLGPLQVVDDFLQRLLLTGGQPERQHSPRRLADAIVDGNRQRLSIGRRRAAPRHDPHLEQEGFLENQSGLRRRCEPVQFLD